MEFFPKLCNHLSKFVDHDGGKIDSSYFALFLSKAEFNLAEVREKMLDNNEFSGQTAVRLCFLTLQAIHDLHQAHYTHRLVHLDFK